MDNCMLDIDRSRNVWWRLTFLLVIELWVEEFKNVVVMYVLEFCLPWIRLLACR